MPLIRKFLLYRSRVVQNPLVNRSIIISSSPSPSLKQTQLAVPGAQGVQGVTGDEVTASERCTNREDYVSTGSLAGSIASASSGFGSLPKKRPALFASGTLPVLFFFFLHYLYVNYYNKILNLTTYMQKHCT